MSYMSGTSSKVCSVPLHCPREVADSPEAELHALLSQDGVYGGLVTRFFETYGYPELAWMHHIACKRYGDAASALIAVQGQASELSEKHVSCISIRLGTMRIDLVAHQ